MREAGHGFEFFLQIPLWILNRSNERHQISGITLFTESVCWCSRIPIYSLELNLRAHSKWCWWRYVRLSLPQTAYRSRTFFGASFSDFVKYFIFWQLRCTGHPHLPPRFSSTSATTTTTTVVCIKESSATNAGHKELTWIRTERLEGVLVRLVGATADVTHFELHARLLAGLLPEVPAQ